MSKELSHTHESLMPVLRWLHSKKHDESDPHGEWHLAWHVMAGLLYGYERTALQQLEHDVHENIGIPTDDCSCEACHG